MESGRKPCGSRAAKMRLRVIITMEKAPSTSESASAMQSTRVLLVAVGDELDDDLGVGGGGEDGAVALQAFARGAEVDEVAVVGDGDKALGGLDGDGLRVEEGGVAGGGVAGVADGDVAGEPGENGVGEDLGDEAHALHVGDVVAVGGGDAGGLLPAMLEGVEAPVGEAGGVGVVVDGHDAAVFAELVEGGGVVVERLDSCTDLGMARRCFFQGNPLCLDSV